VTTTSPPAPTGVERPTRGQILRRFVQGDLASLRVLLGVALIWIIFQSQNDRFLTAINLTNLMLQITAVGLISVGIVYVLLLGEIDLSVGYVSGVAGVIAAVLLIPDGNEVSTPIAIALALGSGIAIGTFHGLLITKIGIPSFVVTLAGLIAWNGVVLLLIGSRGTVVLQNDFLIGLANDFLPDSTSWILWAVAVLIFAGIELNEVRVRLKANLDHDPYSLIALRVAALAICLGAVVYVANEDRGIPYLFLLVGFFFLLWTFVLGRTRFGRYVYAVGGNTEAARRAGVNVDRIKIAVFAICSFMAAVGGLVLASRLRSVDTNAGGGSILLYSIAAAVIGGTSLFGGVGHIKSAILGALVIASIDNGLGLLGLGSGEKFVITGGVLLLAVTVDSLSRKAQTQSGRA